MNTYTRNTTKIELYVKSVTMKRKEKTKIITTYYKINNQKSILLT